MDLTWHVNQATTWDGSYLCVRNAGNKRLMALLDGMKVQEGGWDFVAYKALQLSFWFLPETLRYDIIQPTPPERGNVTNGGTT